MNSIRNVSNLELNILFIVWDKKKVTVRNVYESLLLKDNKYQYIPYTTVMSVMKRLTIRKILKRNRIKQTDFYSTILSKKELFKSIVKAVADLLL